MAEGEVLAAVTVRRLRPDDADLREIVQQLNDADSEASTPFSLESMHRFVADDRNFYLVALVEGCVAGALHAVLHLHPNGSTHMYIDELDTAVPFRRRGVATALMHEILRLSRAAGAKEAWLGADDGNDPAHALYRSLGPSDVEPGTIYTYSADRPGV